VRFLKAQFAVSSRPAGLQLIVTEITNHTYRDSYAAGDHCLLFFKKEAFFSLGPLTEIVVYFPYVRLPKTGLNQARLSAGESVSPV
jgi:hypothetical protein